MEETALLGIVLPPLVGAFLCGVFGRIGGKLSRGAVHGIACGAIGISFVFALISFAKLFGMHEGPEGANPVLSYTAYEWFSLSLRGEAVPVNVRFVMDSLSGVMTLVVTGIGLLIHIYSTGYMSEEPSYGRFFAYLNLFTASMLILVLGSSLPLLFVGWEGVGLCSYLLIGFWYDNPAYAAAGRKAFVANRIGDFGVIIGMFLLMATAGSFEFIDINAKANLMTGDITLPGLVIPGVSIATVATLFLFLGCAGKSAQIPLYVWLPDAMAGPTPVSALIHAATMVTSGLYLICRLSPVFALAPASMAVIAVIGTVTALVAATIGCVQNDIKKVLAYSTVSQLGFMFAAAGCGAFAASFFHVFTHAFFKACMFLGAGSVMHAVGAHGDADIRLLGGLKKWMPKTRITFLVSCLAIAGVPGFSGFFSKDEVLVGALSVGDYFPVAGLGYAVFGGLVIAATMTAFYMFRLYFLTFEGEYRGGPVHDDHGHGHGDDHGHSEPHESPASMTIPLIVLGLGAVFAGYLWIGLIHYEPWVHWLEPALGSIGAEHQGAVVALIGGSLAAVIGIGLAFAWYGKGVGHEAPAKLAASFPGVHKFLFEKWRVDEFYEATILNWSRLAGMAFAGVDKVVVDGVLANLSARVVSGISFLLNRAQNGLVHAYSAVMVAGALAVVLWFAIPQVKIELPDSPKGNEVELSAAKGLGYEYRWDFNADGEPDTEWSADPSASYDYASIELHGVVAVIEPAGYDAKLRNWRVAEGEQVHLTDAMMGLTWRRDPDVFGPPLIVGTAEGLEVTPRNAMARFEGRRLGPDEKVVVGRGQHIDLGQARITVAGEATPTLRVRNAFGVERECQESILLPQVTMRTTVEVGMLSPADGYAAREGEVER